MVLLNFKHNRNTGLQKFRMVDNVDTFWFFDDFLGGTVDDQCWAQRFTGGSYTPTEQRYAGQVKLTSSAVTGQYYEWYLSKMVLSAAKNMGVLWRCKIRTAVTNINAEFGVCGLTPNNQNNRICWKADTTTDASHWNALTSSNGSTTLMDTGVALDMNFHEFCIMTTTGTVSLIMDGAVYPPFTTNISTEQMAPYMRITTVSNTSRQLSADYVECWGDRDTT